MSRRGSEGGRPLRVLGLDVGEKRIGVAVSDPGGTLALPVKVLERKRTDADPAAIAGLVAQYQAEAVVVGLPISLSGQRGPQAQRVQAFVDVLAKALPVPVVTCDERFSTLAARQLLPEERTRRERRKPVDASAAAVILQGYLDRQRATPGP